MIRKLLAGVAAVALASSGAYAAQITVHPTYLYTYSPDFSTTSVMNLGSAAARDPSLHHVFTFSFDVSGLASNQSFAFVLYDINLGAGLVRDAAAPDYSGYNPTWTTGGGSGRSGTMYVNNSDQGASDLKSIFHNSTVNTAAQWNPGEAAHPNQGLGEIYASFTPGYMGASSVATAKITGDSWGIWDGITTGGAPNFNSNGTQVGQSTGFAGETLVIPAVPEPATLGLLGLGALGLVARRRRA